MGHDSFIRDMAHSYEISNGIESSFVWHMAHSYATWLIPMRYQIFSWPCVPKGPAQMGHASFIHMGHDSIKWDMTHSFIWDMTHLFIWDMTHSFIWDTIQSNGT